MGCQSPPSITMTPLIRLPGAAAGSTVYRSPATWAKRPAPSSYWLAPFSSAATTSAPVS